MNITVAAMISYLKSLLCIQRFTTHLFIPLLGKNKQKKNYP